MFSSGPASFWFGIPYQQPWESGFETDGISYDYNTKDPKLDMKWYDTFFWIIPTSPKHGKTK